MNINYLSALFLICNILGTSAIFPSVNGGFSVMAEIKQIDDSDFGKKLLDTIALQLGNKAPLEEVARLLSDVKNNVRKQDEDHLKLHNKQIEECSNDIADYKARIAHATNEIKDANINTGNLRNAVKQFKASFTNKESQIAILAERKKNLINNHEVDQKNFEQRSKEHNEVLIALDIIIPKLESIKTNAKNAKQVFNELARIGGNNPIQSLVEVASTLDQSKLQEVVQKLKSVRNSIAKSLEQDATAQRNADESFNDMLKEVEIVSSNLQNGLKEDKASLTENESNLEDEKARLHQNENELKSARKGMEARKIECVAQDKKWKEESAQRNKEIGVIEKVQEILATRLQTIKGYLKNRGGKDF